LALAGFGIMAHLAATNTILQTIVHDDKRGRVMSLYTMSFLGVAPVGSLLAGWMAGHFGAANTLRIEAGACLIGAATFALALPRLRAYVRPVYVSLGLLPEIASSVVAPARPSVAPRSLVDAPATTKDTT
jgi:MFS family permease